MKMKKSMLLLFILILIFAHCDLTEPPTKASLTLSLEEVSCTEAWLRLQSTNLQIPNSITMKQNGQARMTMTITTADTLLFIDSLLPNQSYKFQLFSQSSIQSINQTSVSSNEVTVTTLDTTSHNFTWQTFTFGEHSSSVLYDVAIINENNIWAVGEIYMNDSLGNPDPTFYNVVHWDGAKWELLRLRFNCRLYFPNCGPDTMLLSIAYSIFAIDENNIWVSAGSVHHFNGTAWIQEAGIQGVGSANKIWGNTNELWFVGNNGFISHRSNNGNWSKIESGTTTRIGDIWGIISANNKVTVYCAVSSFFVPGDKKVIRIANNSLDSIPWAFNRLLYSVWTPNNHVMYACGDGIFERRNNEWKEINITTVSTNRVRGNGLNDIFIIGDFGFISHFNGFTWNIEEYDFNAGYGGLSVNGSVTACVGQRNGKALIKVGKRN